MTGTIDWKKAAKEYIDLAKQLLRLFEVKYGSKAIQRDWKNLNLPREGHIAGYDYTFHGVGIRFEKGEEFCLEIELLSDIDNIYFDAFRLNSYFYTSELYQEITDENVIRTALDGLCLEGFLEPHPERGSYFKISSRYKG